MRVGTDWRSHYDSYRSGLREKNRLQRTASGRDFGEWALGLVDFAAGVQVVDAGCGWGRFSAPLLTDGRVAASDLVAIDVSTGMLGEYRLNVATSAAEPGLVAASIEALPLVSERFDVVMANHVLYHLGDLPKGIEELRRVLSADGRLLATTNSGLPRTVIDLHHEAMRGLGIGHEAEETSTFSLENGADALSEVFGEVERFTFEDEMVYASASEFAVFYRSTGRFNEVAARTDVATEVIKKLPRVVAGLAAQEFGRADGRIVTPVVMGAFVCSGVAASPPR